MISFDVKTLIRKVLGHAQIVENLRGREKIITAKIVKLTKSEISFYFGCIVVTDEWRQVQ